MPPPAHPRVSWTYLATGRDPGSDTRRISRAACSDSGLSLTAIGQGTKEEKGIGRAFRQAPGEIAVPLRSKRHVDSSAVACRGEALLFSAAHPEQHLMFEFVCVAPMASSQVCGDGNQSRVMSCHHRIGTSGEERA